MRWEFQLLISMCSRRLVLYAICGGFCATHVSEFRELVCAASFCVVCISVELEVYANTRSFRCVICGGFGASYVPVCIVNPFIVRRFFSRVNVSHVVCDSFCASDFLFGDVFVCAPAADQRFRVVRARGWADQCCLLWFAREEQARAACN